MKKTFRLQIPSPCTENWQEMTPVEKGRFCLHCQKKVVDFTNMTGNEIAFFLAQQKESVCGHIRKTQLTQSFPYIQPTPSHSPFKKYLMALLTTGLILNPLAPYLPATPHLTTQNLSLFLQTPFPHTATNNKIISGYLRYEKTGKPAPNEKIILTNRSITWGMETTTNAEGYFEFEMTDDIQEDDYFLYAHLTDNRVYDDTHNYISGKVYEVAPISFFYAQKSPSFSLKIKENVSSIDDSDVLIDGLMEIEVEMD